MGNYCEAFAAQQLARVYLLLRMWQLGKPGKLRLAKSRDVFSDSGERCPIRMVNIVLIAYLLSTSECALWVSVFPHNNMTVLIRTS